MGGNKTCGRTESKCTWGQFCSGVWADKLLSLGQIQNHFQGIESSHGLWRLWGSSVVFRWPQPLEHLASCFQRQSPTPLETTLLFLYFQAFFFCLFVFFFSFREILWGPFRDPDAIFTSEWDLSLSFFLWFFSFFPFIFFNSVLIFKDRLWVREAACQKWDGGGGCLGISGWSKGRSDGFTERGAFAGMSHRLGRRSGYIFGGVCSPGANPFGNQKLRDSL